MASKFKLEKSNKNLLKTLHQKSTELVKIEEASAKLRKENMEKDDLLAKARAEIDTYERTIKDVRA
jgi:hypothetical protein